ncbi:MAG TPA: hypothetical protein DCL38_04270 [Lachnospiraceae bacterium]|nr:hypothetical protein [Lachnospiraceae bacterium]
MRIVAFKRKIAFLLTAVMLAGAISGCQPAQLEALHAYAESIRQLQAAEEQGSHEEALNGSEAAQEAEDELALRMEAEKPWVNSMLIGTVKELGYAPDIKDDFYAAANAEWLKAAELEPGHVRAGSFDELGTVRRDELMALMTDDSLEGEDAEKCRNLYNLWLDWDARNSFDNIGEIKKHIEPVEAINDMDELSSYLSSEECWYYGNCLSSPGIDLDNKDSDKYSVFMHATELTLGDPAEYEALTENGKRTKEAADETSRYMLGRAGYNADEIESLLQAKYDFEAKLAAFEMSVQEWNSPSAIELTYNPVTLEELSELSPAYPFTEILETAGYAKSQYLNLPEPEWLKGLNELYTEESLEGIKAYIIDDIVTGYIGLIDEEAYRKAQEISMKRNGISEVSSDEELAYNFTATRLSASVSRMFTEKYMTEEIKEEIESIIGDATDYYRRMLSDVDWLSDETREKAVGKLDKIGVKAVYPDKWVDESAIVILSGKEGETLLSAVDKIDRFNHEYSTSLVNTEVDHSYWMSEDVTQINSFYYPNTNEIYIIAGILGGDFYRSDMSIEEKLGGIGTVIGHELSHAFDTRGAQFDGDGNVADWWTEEDYNTFQKRADRLISYMGSMTVDGSGKNYNGALVQTETIADMAGLKCMLALASQIDGFDYDKFFRSYARTWKTIATKEYVDYLIAADVHALEYLRVNAIVQQFEEFYDTYGITEGDGMYLAPEDRVAVW